MKLGETVAKMDAVLDRLEKRFEDYIVADDQVNVRIFEKLEDKMSKSYFWKMAGIGVAIVTGAVGYAFYQIDGLWSTLYDLLIRLLTKT